MNEFPLLHVVGLTYRYPCGTEALSGVTLQCYAGRAYALTGPNGSGKSTLLGCLAGVLRPSAGTIMCGGETLIHTNQGLNQWRRRVGLVLQQADDQIIAPRVGQDIAYGPYNQGLSNEEALHRARQVAAELDLDPLFERPTHGLSHGERKRVALAGILAMEPEVLLLDEPTAGLDEQAQATLLETLDRQRNRGCTVLLATHDPRLAKQWADQRIPLQAGRIRR